jgi:lysyl-tRNA synthetase class II
MDQRDEIREKREKESVATAAYDVLKALGSRAAGSARELRTALKDDKPAPPQLIRDVHGALLEGLMDKRVKSAEVKPRKLFGIPLEAEMPAKSRMRALVKRFELSFMRPALKSSAAGPDRT